MRWMQRCAGLGGERRPRAENLAGRRPQRCSRLACHLLQEPCPALTISPRTASALLRVANPARCASLPQV